MTYIKKLFTKEKKSFFAVGYAKVIELHFCTHMTSHAN